MLKGGHVIMLGTDPLSQVASIEALRAYHGALFSTRLPMHLSAKGQENTFDHLKACMQGHRWP